MKVSSVVRARVSLRRIGPFAIVMFSTAVLRGESCPTVGWVDRTPSGPSPRWYHSMYYDSHRRATVLVGGIEAGDFCRETWVWDGVTWSRCPVATPDARCRMAVSFDSQLESAVLYGGSPAFNDTWIADGAACGWESQYLANSPDASVDRQRHAMVYDAARHCTVLFGGEGVFGLRAAETWGFDAAVREWHMLADAGYGPPPLAGHGMAYDARRGRVVLFGGETAGGISDETWEWDGAHWSLAEPIDRPTARQELSMVYHAAIGKVVMFGGMGHRPDAETWTWDGSNWTLLSTPVAPAARRAHGMAYDADRGVIVLFGGASGQRTFSDTWEFDGSRWSLRSGSPEASSRPAIRARHAMAYDSHRQVGVLFGGENIVTGMSDTWEWNGRVRTWTLKSVTGPPGRLDHRMVFDAARGHCVLFGGATIMDRLRDTWTWDGTTWVRLYPTTSPPGRYAHAMANDSRNERIVLFGGNTGALPGVPASDTWLWNGSTWNQLNVSGPAARANHDMAFDAARGVMVLFGGVGAGGVVLGDTWEFDGTNWSARPAIHGPSARRGHAMAYDAALGVVTLVGGYDGVRSCADAWNWDGEAWTRIERAGPAPRFDATLIFDDSHSRTFLFGGQSGTRFIGESWEFGTIWTAADANCDGTVNPFDVSPFIQALIEKHTGYVSDGGDESCWGARLSWGDFNGDATINAFDIISFVECIGG